MLVAGYLGEVEQGGTLADVYSGLARLDLCHLRVFAGEASKINANSGSGGIKASVSCASAHVTVGWAIYPIGYFLGYTGGADLVS